MPLSRSRRNHTHDQDELHTDDATVPNEYQTLSRPPVISTNYSASENNRLLTRSADVVLAVIMCPFRCGAWRLPLFWTSRLWLYECSQQATCSSHDSCPAVSKDMPTRGELEGGGQLFRFSEVGDNLSVDCAGKWYPSLHPSCAYQHIALVRTIQLLLIYCNSTHGFTSFEFKSVTSDQVSGRHRVGRFRMFSKIPVQNTQKRLSGLSDDQ